MIKKLVFVLLVVVLGAAGVTAQENRLQVVASFTILADVARNVAGDAADVASLIPPDADPHAYTPTPGDLALVADAEVVFVNGAQFEEGLLNTIASVMEDKTPVVASTCVEILPFGAAAPAADVTPVPDNATAQRCADEVSELEAYTPDYPVLGRLYAVDCAAGHEHEAGEDEHDEGNCDPHVWFDPYNVELWALTIRDSLSDLDPANADLYRQNAAAYVEQIEALRQETAAQIAALPEDRRVLVTDHDALGYFAATYGFEIVGLVVPSVSTVAEPSAQEFAQLIDTIRAQHVPAVFAGVTVSPTLSQQVAAEAGAQFYTVYTESLSDSGGAAPTYLDFMRYNVETIVAALS